MKVFVINMKQDVERKEFIEKQFSDIGITDYEIIEAVNGKEQLNNDNCDMENFKSKHKREILPGEFGCAKSHTNIYDLIIELDEPALILEDDVLIEKELKHLTNATKIPFDFDVIFLNERHAHKISRTYGGLGEYEILNGVKLEKLTTNRLEIGGLVPCWTTCSYIISPQAAQKVKDINTPINSLADSWYHFRLESFYRSEKIICKQNHADFKSTIR